MFVSDDLALNPIVLAHPWVWITTLGTSLATLVVRVVTAPSAAYMCLLAGELAHRSGSFSHFIPLLFWWWRDDNYVIAPNYNRTKVVGLSFIEDFNRIF